MAKLDASPPGFNKNPNRVSSFRYAFEGIGYVLRTQPNAWIHAGITTLVIIMGLWLGISLRDWAVLVLAISSVWVGEFLNTSIEAVVDLASPEIHPLAKVAKDVCAGAVLVAAILAAIVGLLILGPPLLTRLWPWISGLAS